MEKGEAYNRLEFTDFVTCNFAAVECDGLAYSVNRKTPLIGGSVSRYCVYVQLILVRQLTSIGTKDTSHKEITLLGRNIVASYDNP